MKTWVGVKTIWFGFIKETILEVFARIIFVTR